MLSVAWNLLMYLPLQKVITTNSGDLLSLVPVEQVCRLVLESLAGGGDLPYREAKDES
ncbi:MAG: DUF2813 domain-containing protein [Symbiopectobacterium sp.]